jgi:hypothetical protein
MAIEVKPNRDGFPLRFVFRAVATLCRTELERSAKPVATLCRIGFGIGFGIGIG